MLYTPKLLPYFSVGLILPFIAQVTTSFETSGEISPAQIIVFLIVYLIYAFFCLKIFQKLNYANSWFAWIPFLNQYATFELGEERNALLWTILLIVPCVNIVATVMLYIAWGRIFRRLGQSPWLALVLLIPCVNLALLGYFAFS